VAARALSPLAACALAGLVALAAAACDRAYDGAGDLRAQRVVLEREVEGLREVVGRLERGEPLLPPDDVAIAVDDSAVRALILAQLPFEADVERFRVRLTDADVQFRGSPTLQLRGRLQVREQPDVTALVTLFGALDDIRVDRATSTLSATVAADHIALDEATGLAAYLSGATLDEAARRIRLAMRPQLPVIRIPVAVREQLDVPAVTDGPVRLAAFRLPLEAAVSQVVAARGRLWASVRVAPGEVTSPPAGEPRR
jgi:hypothetical protein